MFKKILFSCALVAIVSTSLIGGQGGGDKDKDKEKNSEPVRHFEGFSHYQPMVSFFDYDGQWFLTFNVVVAVNDRVYIDESTTSSVDTDRRFEVYILGKNESLPTGATRAKPLEQWLRSYSRVPSANYEKLLVIRNGSTVYEMHTFSTPFKGVDKTHSVAFVLEKAPAGSPLTHKGGGLTHPEG